MCLFLVLGNVSELGILAFYASCLVSSINGEIINLFWNFLLLNLDTLNYGITFSKYMLSVELILDSW